MPRKNQFAEWQTMDPWRIMSPEDHKEANRLWLAAMRAYPSSPKQIELHRKLELILAKYGLAQGKMGNPTSQESNMAKKCGIIRRMFGLCQKRQRAVGNSSDTDFGPTWATERSGDWPYVPGTMYVPKRMWMRVMDILVEYHEAGRSWALAGKPRGSASTYQRFLRAEEEYNNMYNAIAFAKWTKEQSEEWDRIATYYN